jgi:hypothetical protein
MTLEMNPNMNLADLARMKAQARAWLAEGRIWPDILADFEAEGYFPIDLKLLLRSMGAWSEKAQELKSEGWPYEDLVLYLSELLATWQDVAWALLQAGLRPPDMLRAVFPAACGSEFEASIVQLALARNEAVEECRGVLDWYGISV